MWLQELANLVDTAGATWLDHAVALPQWASDVVLRLYEEYSVDWLTVPALIRCGFYPPGAPCVSATLAALRLWARFLHDPWEPANRLSRLVDATRAAAWQRRSPALAAWRRRHGKEARPMMLRSRRVAMRLPSKP